MLCGTDIIPLHFPHSCILFYMYQLNMYKDGMLWLWWGEWMDFAPQSSFTRRKPLRFFFSPDILNMTYKK